MARMRIVSREEAMAILFNHEPASDERKEDEIIIFKVGAGEDEVHFEVHKDLLCSCSEIFREYFASNPSVTEIDRPDEDPYIFSLCVQWLYNHAYANPLPAGLPSPSPTPSSTIITPEQKAQLLKLLTRVSKTQYASPFRKPVTEIWPEYAESYASQIDKPIDLSTISAQLASDKYYDINELKLDFELLYNNTVQFNGLASQVSKFATTLHTKVFEKIDALNFICDGPGVVQSNTPRKYNSALEKREGEDTKSRELRHTLQKLICVAERYRFDSLSALCMNNLTALYKKHRLTPSAESILYIYSQTNAGSKLRLYFARALAHMIVTKAPNEGIETEWIWECMKDNDELGVDVLGELRGKNGVKVAEAEDADPCEYHWHGEEYLCSVKMY